MNIFRKRPEFDRAWGQAQEDLAALDSRRKNGTAGTRDVEAGIRAEEYLKSFYGQRRRPLLALLRYVGSWLIFVGLGYLTFALIVLLLRPLLSYAHS